MTRNNDNGIKPGGMNDPVAQNLRAQRNQDARPSKEEVKRKARQTLKERGCTECGEDDPDKLGHYGVKAPECPTVQVPSDPFEVYCDTCAEERKTLREQALERAHEKNENSDVPVVAVVFYECQNHSIVREETIDIGDGEEIPVSAAPAPDDTTKASLKCWCGSKIDDIEYLD